MKTDKDIQLLLSISGNGWLRELFGITPEEVKTYIMPKDFTSSDEVVVKAFLEHIVGISEGVLGQVYTAITSNLEVKHVTKSGAEASVFREANGANSVIVHAIGFHNQDPKSRNKTDEYRLDQYYQQEGTYKAGVIRLVGSGILRKE